MRSEWKPNITLQDTFGWPAGSRIQAKDEGARDLQGPVLGAGVTATNGAGRTALDPIGALTYDGGPSGVGVLHQADTSRTTRGKAYTHRHTSLHPVRRYSALKPQAIVPIFRPATNKMVIDGRRPVRGPLVLDFVDTRRFRPCLAALLLLPICRRPLKCFKRAVHRQMSRGLDG